MVSLHIIDDVLDYETRNELVQYMYKNKFLINGMISFNKDPYDHFIKDNSALGFLFRVAEKFFDFSTAVGYERWYNVDNGPSSWHVDKDENHFKETGEIKNPFCTILYYPHVSDSLRGGNLRMKFDESSEGDLIIRPKTNRLVVFSPGVIHMVEQFYGERCSMVINPWSYELT